MTSATNAPSGSRWSLKFSYDWQGRRISKVVSNWTGSAWTIAVSNKFVYDGWNLVAELNGTNNALIRSYLWGSDLSGGDDAGGVGGLLAVRVQGAGTNFVAMDGNGNVTALVSASDGTVKASYEYGPFGELVRAEGPMAKGNQFRFSTKYQDDESDFVYYGYRYLGNGRWLNRDPLEEDGGLNLYAFVGNDGVNQVDRLGMVSSLNFVSASELAWMLGGGAALDTGLSIGMQRLTRDPCSDKWLDWGQLGKDVGIGAGINLATFGLASGIKYYKAAKLARALGEAEELRALGHYDELAGMVARYGDDFGDSLANYKRAKAAVTGFNGAADAGKTGMGAAESGVWRLRATARGTTIENRLAATEYSDWFRAGQLDNGTFPLIDFQKGNNLVSLKTVDTTGSTWLGQMQGHIDDLATRGATVNGNPANMILDIRVQPGGTGAAQQLIGYGQRQGVTVIVKEFP